ncbi:MAG: hypothetical protein ABI700_15805 [Chloroflexota bacterium]
MLNTKASTVPSWTRWHTLGLGLLLVGMIGLELFVPGDLRVTTWLSVLALLVVFALLVGHGITGRWLGVLIDSTNKISLSRLQMLLWTILILSGLLTAVAANVAAGVDEPLTITVPASLWLLMGISTASMIGSPILQNVQQQRAASVVAKQQALAQFARRSVDPVYIRFSGQMVMNQSVDAASIADIFAGSGVSTVGLVDIGQIQMFFFTLTLLFAYGTGLAHLFSTEAPLLAFPTLDAGMVALLGISHTGFLVNQAIPQNVSSTNLLN